MQFTATNQIKLGLFKNLHISPSSGQKMACIFGPIGLKSLMGTQETIIYREI